jgi:triosephosphate isomerase
MVNSKVAAALAAGLTPILCIGESDRQNSEGLTREVLSSQVRAGLQGIVPDRRLVIAYEPIWAIGTGKAATGAAAGQTIGFIRETLSSIWSEANAAAVRILYGGSASSLNIAEFLREPEIDGALVGGASLKAADFIEIVCQASLLKQQK